MKLPSKRDSVPPRHLCQQMKVLVLRMKGLLLVVSVPTHNSCLQRENDFSPVGSQWVYKMLYRVGPTPRSKWPTQEELNSIFVELLFIAFIGQFLSYLSIGLLLVHIDDPFCFSVGFVCISCFFPYLLILFVTK